MPLTALRECHESRGTRFSERHTAHLDAGGRPRRNARSSSRWGRVSWLHRASWRWI